MPLQPNEITFDQPEKKVYELLEEDTYSAELLDVSLREEASYADKSIQEKRINFEFVIIEEGPNYGRRAWKSTSPKCMSGGGDFRPSNLFVVLSAVAGRALTEEECAGVTTDFINSFIGSQVRLVIKQKTSVNGKEYNAIGDFMKIKTTLPKFDSSKVKKDDTVDTVAALSDDSLMDALTKPEEPVL